MRNQNDTNFLFVIQQYLNFLNSLTTNQINFAPGLLLSENLDFNQANLFQGLDILQYEAVGLDSSSAFIVQSADEHRHRIQAILDADSENLHEAMFEANFEFALLNMFAVQQENLNEIIFDQNSELDDLQENEFKAALYAFAHASAHIAIENGVDVEAIVQNKLQELQRNMNGLDQDLVGIDGNNTSQPVRVVQNDVAVASFIEEKINLYADHNQTPQQQAAYADLLEQLHAVQAGESAEGLDQSIQNYLDVASPDGQQNLSQDIVDYSIENNIEPIGLSEEAQSEYAAYALKKELLIEYAVPDNLKYHFEIDVSAVGADMNVQDIDNCWNDGKLRRESIWFFEAQSDLQDRYLNSRHIDENEIISFDEFIRECEAREDNNDKYIVFDVDDLDRLCADDVKKLFAYSYNPDGDPDGYRKGAGHISMDEWIDKIVEQEQGTNTLGQDLHFAQSVNLTQPTSL